MSYLESGPKIYGTMEWGGIADSIRKRDVIAKLKNIEGLGYKWCSETSTLKMPVTFMGMTEKSPWVHTNIQNTKRCGMDHNVIFNTYGIIPPRCMECWKVCCSIPDFDHLMKMKKMQEGVTHISSKCGIELRDYAPKHYGAYFYTGSLDEGREVYTEMRERIDDEVGPDVGVILKRACTEFEFINGPSPLWVNTQEEEEMIQLIEQYVDMGKANIRQDKLLQDNIMLKWFIWANSNGDFSYVPYNGGKKLFPDYVTYHEGDLDGIKKDLAVCRSAARYNVPSEVTTEIIKLNTEIATKHNIPLDLIYQMGHNGSASLRLSTPEILIGEQDELT